MKTIYFHENYLTVSVARTLAPAQGGKRIGRGSDAGEGFVQSAVSKNRQDRTEYLILHDRIFPYDRIDDRRIEISRVGV
jgi:hypothetical protein